MTSPMSFRSTSSLAVCHPSPRSTSTSKSSCHLMALTCANPSVTMQHCRFYAHTPGAGGSRMGRGALTSWFGPESGTEAHRGPGTQWSQAVQPGDQVAVRGPGGH